MYLYQYVTLLVLIVLWFKASDKGAFYLLIRAFFSAVLVVIDIPAEHYNYYYLICGTLDLIVGIRIQRKHKISAVCSYSLVLANIYGYGLWLNYYDPISYDIICAILIIIQTIGIFPSGTFDRVRRIFIKSSLVKHAGFNRNQAYAKMLKNTPEKETHK